MKWTIEDVATSEVWTFLHNPYEMQTPTTSRRTQGHPRGLAFRPGAVPFAWSFKGRVYTEGEYAILLDWSTRGRVRITDHLGRIHLVTPQAFDPIPRRSTASGHWRYTYTFLALYLGRES